MEQEKAIAKREDEAEERRQNRIDLQLKEEEALERLERYANKYKQAQELYRKTKAVVGDAIKDYKPLSYFEGAYKWENYNKQEAVKRVLEYFMREDCPEESPFDPEILLKSEEAYAESQAKAWEEQDYVC